MKASAAGSTAEEQAGILPSQPSPGSSGVRNGFEGIVSVPQKEDRCEEVVKLDEDHKVFLEEKEEKEVEVREPKRRSAALRFSRKVVERPPTYDELIEGVSQIAFPEDLDIELEIPWEERFF